MSFTAYESHPWVGIETNQRDWYEPALRDWYVRRSIYGPFVANAYNLQANKTQNAHITQLLAPHPNFNTYGSRDMWLNSSYIDSREVQIGADHHAGKLAFHKFDFPNSCRLAA
jgi:hypothetical protein